jgi:hypothetical protein
MRLFREFLGSLRIVVTFGGLVKVARHARPRVARKIVNVVLTVNGKTANQYLMNRGQTIPAQNHISKLERDNVPSHPALPSSQR